MDEGMTLVKIVRGGKVTIPRYIREQFALKDGDYLAVDAKKDEGEIVYIPVTVKRTKPQ